MKIHKGFSLIAMLLSLVIIAVVYYFISKANLSTSTLGKKTKKTLNEHGIDTSNYKEMIDSTKKQVDDINKRIKEKEKQLQEFK